MHAIAIPKASNFNNRTVMSFVFAQWHCYKRTLNFFLTVKKNMASSISFVACFLLSTTMWSVEGQSCVKLDPELFAPCVNIGYAHTLPLPSYVDINEVSEMLNFFRDKVIANCSVPRNTTDTLNCAMLLPLCVEGRKTPLLPCRQVCADALQGCTNSIEARILDEVGAMCNVLPDSTATSGMRGVSDKLWPITLSYCCCCLTNPFSQEKVWSKHLRLFHLGGSAEPPEPPLDPPQSNSSNSGSNSNSNSNSIIAIAIGSNSNSN